MSARIILQSLAVCATAGFAGAMLTIGLVLGAYWQGLPPAEFLSWFGAHSSLIARVIPLFLLPSLVGLGASCWLARRAPEGRLWLAALGCMLALCAITLAYHLPLNARFSAGAVPVEAVPGLLSGWLGWHAARVGLGFLAAALALAAMWQGTRAGLPHARQSLSLPA